MHLFGKYSVGPVGCVGFVKLKGVECICLLSILLGALGLLICKVLNVFAC